jgi:excisionase family DNA binding protein
MTTAVDLAKLVAHHELAATLPPTVIPTLLAEVERLKAALWMRLVTSLIDSARANPEPGPPRLLTVPQVADLVGVPAGNIYALVRRGELPAIRLGKYVRVDPAEFKKWLAQHQLADQVDGGLCHWYTRA